MGKRVLISTLHPLGGNYGGILQAYALQKVLTELGHMPTTINSPGLMSKPRFLMRYLRYLASQVRGGKSQKLPLSPRKRNFIQDAPRDFVERNMATIFFHSLPQEERENLLAELDAIVVGSDQVWRGGYANISDQLLEFAEDREITRISYAASFGGSDLIRFTEPLIEKSARLASRFDHISVREQSGIGLCEKYWNVSAEQHVDPTLLLTRESYEDLIASSPYKRSTEDGGLLTYILDNSASRSKIVSQISQQLGVSAFEMLAPHPAGEIQYFKDPTQFQMAPIEAWLEKFSKADFIVTDSFHGTVFAILFNKPFVAIGNERRGIDRFTSLLNQFGLASRLIYDTDRIDLATLETPDWGEVNRILKSERARSKQYLLNSL